MCSVVFNSSMQTTASKNRNPTGSWHHSDHNARGTITSTTPSAYIRSVAISKSIPKRSLHFRTESILVVDVPRATRHATSRWDCGLRFSYAAAITELKRVPVHETHSDAGVRVFTTGTSLSFCCPSHGITPNHTAAASYSYSSVMTSILLDYQNCCVRT